MGRIIVICGVLLALIFAVVIATSMLGRAVQAGVTLRKEANVPKTAKTISYVLLIVLMFGVVSGRLGGL